jgi:hypothetical protein
VSIDTAKMPLSGVNIDPLIAIPSFVIGV